MRERMLTLVEFYSPFWQQESIQQRSEHERRDVAEGHHRTNLAAMDWQASEQPIRELLEKESSGRGAAVKISQAGRYRSTDAIAFLQPINDSEIRLLTQAESVLAGTSFTPYSYDFGQATNCSLGGSLAS
jgi:hypothetical protein